VKPFLCSRSGSVDQRILQHMIDTKAEFLMEVTDKTKADIKAGLTAYFIVMAI
jgi:UDP-N-acetylglucosamine pyrophosphorylase